MTTDEQIILELTRKNRNLENVAQARAIQLSFIRETLKKMGIGATYGLLADFDTGAGVSELKNRIESLGINLADKTHKLSGRLFLVTIPTSIDDIEEYVIATDKERVEAYLKETHPHGFAKGYEPKIKEMERLFGPEVVWLS